MYNSTNILQACVSLRRYTTAACYTSNMAAFNTVDKGCHCRPCLHTFFSFSKNVGAETTQKKYSLNVDLRISRVKTFTQYGTQWQLGLHYLGLKERSCSLPTLDIIHTAFIRQRKKNLYTEEKLRNYDCVAIKSPLFINRLLTHYFAMYIHSSHSHQQLRLKVLFTVTNRLRYSDITSVLIQATRPIKTTVYAVTEGGQTQKQTA